MTPCRFSETCRATGRHEHAYSPPEGGQRQCVCGSRRWKVKTGGPLPTGVFCGRCAKQSRINSMFERGRELPAAVDSGTADTPPF